MASATGRLLTAAGLLFLVATGYQAMAYREHLRLTQQEFEGLPLQLLLQLAGAAVVCLLGGLRQSGEFRPIRLADIDRPVVLHPHRTDFAAFNSRARALETLPYLRSAGTLPAIS